MPPGIGYGRDIPIATEQGAGGAQGGRRGGLSPQQAVKILSLRVPERPTPGALAPLPLLTAPGGDAAGAADIIDLIGSIIGNAPGGGGVPGSGLPGGPPPMGPMLPSMPGPSAGPSSFQTPAAPSQSSAPPP